MAGGALSPDFAEWSDVRSTGAPAPGGALGLALAAARPTPFRTSTAISYALPRAGVVTLAVLDGADSPARLYAETRNQ